MPRSIAALVAIAISKPRLPLEAQEPSSPKPLARSISACASESLLRYLPQ